MFESLGLRCRPIAVSGNCSGSRERSSALLQDLGEVAANFIDKNNQRWITAYFAQILVITVCFEACIRIKLYYLRCRSVEFNLPITIDKHTPIQTPPTTEIHYPCTIAMLPITHTQTRSMDRVYKCCHRDPRFMCQSFSAS